MKAAIFFSGKFGSTEQYSQWLSEATGFPVYDLTEQSYDPEDYDLLILGSSIIIGKLSITKWLKAVWPRIKSKPIVLFTVSGTEPGHPNLKKWLNDSLSEEILEPIHYVALRGRLNPQELSWWTRLLLKLGSWAEKDPDTKKRMAEGFDYMEKANIKPILEWVEQHGGEVGDKMKSNQLQFA